MKKIIKFNYEYFEHTGNAYYIARVGKLQIHLQITDNYLDYFVHRLEYFKEPYCSLRSCKKSGTKRCKEMWCKKTVKFLDSYESHSEYVPFDHIAKVLEIDNYSDTPIEKIKLAKHYLLRIINNDQRCFDLKIDFICPKKDVKKYESRLWDIDGVLV